MATSKSITKNKGESVAWSVTRTGYITQSGNWTATQDTTINVDLVLQSYSFTVVVDVEEKIDVGTNTFDSYAISSITGGDGAASNTVKFTGVGNSSGGNGGRSVGYDKSLATLWYGPNTIIASAGQVESVIFTGTYYIAANNTNVLYRSTDARTWTAISPTLGLTFSCHCLAANPSKTRFYALSGAGQLMYTSSKDGTGWTGSHYITGSASTVLKGVWASDNRVVAFGDGSNTIYRSTTTTPTSTDMWVSLTFANLSAGNGPYACYYDTNRFVFAIGNASWGACFDSTSTATSGAAFISSTYPARGVIFNGSVWLLTLVTGTNTSTVYYANTPTLATSLAFTWTKITDLGNGSDSVPFQVYSTAYDNGHLAMGGSGGTLFVTDALRPLNIVCTVDGVVLTPDSTGRTFVTTKNYNQVVQYSVALDGYETVTGSHTMSASGANIVYVSLAGSEFTLIINATPDDANITFV